MTKPAKAADSYRTNQATVDFTQGREVHELASYVPTRSRYVHKLQTIADAVAAGEAEIGKVYPIGRYNDPGTADATCAQLAKRDDLPAGVEFNLIPERDSRTTSVLWAGVIDPDSHFEAAEPDDGEPTVAELAAIEAELAEDAEWTGGDAA